MSDDYYSSEGDYDAPLGVSPKPKKKRFIRDKHLLHPDIIFKSNHISLKLRAFYTLVWLSTLGVFIFFVVRISGQLKESYENPASRVVQVPRSEASFPEVTICNWHQLNGRESPTNQCLDCEVTLVQCRKNYPDPAAQATDCADLWRPIKIFKPIEGIIGEGLTFYCIQFNFDNQIFTNASGYGGSYSTLIEIPKLRDTRTNRRGVQVTFSIPGHLTADNLYDELNAAPIDYDTYFSLTFTRTTAVHDDDSESDLSEGFETSVDSIRLARQSNDTADVVGVSFGFEKLAISEVQQKPLYSIELYFGELSAMFLLLLGLHFAKLTAGIRAIYLSIRYKTLTPITQHFMG